MRIALVTCVVLAASAVAQTQMPIPTFASTFSAAGLTRGFHFQSPVSFTITGLRVPDETLNGTQNVEVILLSGDPAIGGATATSSLFYSTNLPSQNVIPCNVVVNQGAWIGILGACGTTTMHNSYGASPFNSSVLGAPVAISRLMLQANLNAGSAAGQTLVTGTLPLGRVEVYITGLAGFATALPYGQGCNSLAHSASARPVIGTSISLDTTNAPASTILGVTAFGLTEIVPGLDLTSLGAPGCFQHLFIDAAVAWIPAAGAGSTQFSIPNDPSFAGVEIKTQGACLVPGVNQLGALSANGVRLVIDVN